MEGWERLFREHILERGLVYFYEGAVTKLQKTGEGYRATVEGSRNYSVKIKVRDGEIYDMFCSCPYAEDGNNCKHMAAVLYKIKETQEGEATDSWGREKKQEDRELDGVIAQIPEEELRRIVKSIAAGSDEVKNRIFAKYSEKIDVGMMTRLKQEVDEIVYRHNDRYGFINYRDAWDFITELRSFLDDKVWLLIEREYLMQAFEMTNYVFETVRNVDIDDSDGGTEQIADACYEMWRCILENGSQEEKQKMFQWFSRHQSGEGNDLMEDYINNFLMNEFHEPEMLKKKLEALDNIISRQENSADCGGSFSLNYGLQNNILNRLEIMEELEYPEEEIRAYRKKNWKFSAVRKLEIQEDIDAGKWKEAIAVLKESRELDKESPGWVDEYSRQLIAIYEKLSSEREYKKELESYVFLSRQSGLAYINKLKAICTEEEWVKYREKLLQAEGSYRIRYELMEAEGLYERLLQEIQKKGTIYNLNRYEKVLKERFPEQTREMYVSYLCHQAERTADRKVYREWMNYLKKIRTYPGGDEIVEEIARKWKRQYPRRSAMMEEMRKAGF